MAGSVVGPRGCGGRVVEVSQAALEGLLVLDDESLLVELHRMVGVGALVRGAVAVGDVGVVVELLGRVAALDVGACG